MADVMGWRELVHPAYITPVGGDAFSLRKVVSVPTGFLVSVVTSVRVQRRVAPGPVSFQFGLTVVLLQADARQNQTL